MHKKLLHDYEIVHDNDSRLCSFSVNYGWTSELLSEIFTPNSHHNVSIAQLIYSIKTKYIKIVISITMLKSSESCHDKNVHVALYDYIKLKLCIACSMLRSSPPVNFQFNGSLSNVSETCETRQHHMALFSKLCISLCIALLVYIYYVCIYFVHK